MATGDAQSNTFAQNINSPNGKILRLNIDGTVPADNPIKGSLVWAMGFRNIQGMVFSRSGKLYASEHGDATDDEVNLIEKTKNYGWPEIHAFADNAKELPSFAFLKDNEIAAIANYVMNMQAEKYPSISLQDIAKARAQ